MSFVNEQKGITRSDLFLLLRRVSHAFCHPSVIIDSEMPRGVKLKEQGGSDRRFKDLYELLQNYREYLVAPLETTLPAQPWSAAILLDDVLFLSLTFLRLSPTQLITYLLGSTVT